STMLRRSPRSPLFPYTTLFRSEHAHLAMRRRAEDAAELRAEQILVLQAQSDAAQPQDRVGLAVLQDGREVLLATQIEGANHHLRSEEHTSELQSRVDLVCRLLL